MGKKDKMHFIEQIIQGDLRSGKHETIRTRFPPEPNGYLHIGHAKSIVLNFSLSERFEGETYLRFDDTNPVTESVEYVESIKKDIQWLGYQWAGDIKFTSDYFEQLYQFARKLIQEGLAYVDDSSIDEIASQKGNVNEPGVASPYRDRSVEENLELFSGMKEGKYGDGEKVLRAKIDMAHPNMHMRDPILYRIKHVEHHRTGKEWCIYPMYDFAHGQSDSIENITHSICTLEFENHRPLYDWLIEHLEIYPSRQIEFSRLNLTYTIMSKRKLLKLVEGNYVSAWDDPRMPTISGMRRRGYPPSAIRQFAKDVGVTKRSQFIDLSRLENTVRKELNKTATRVMAVLDPLLLEIVNFPEDQVELLSIINNPEDSNSDHHEMPFSRQLYIEKEDFMVDPPEKFFRLSPGSIVRLKGAFIIECLDYETDDSGQVTKVRAKYFENSKSGEDTSGIRAKGTLHWVSAEHSKDVTVHQYDRLFSEEFPGKEEGSDFLDSYNKNSLEVITGVKAEPYLFDAEEIEAFQFLRKAYFVRDKNSTKENPIFNQTVSLKDNWS